MSKLIQLITFLWIFKSCLGAEYNCAPHARTQCIINGLQLTKDDDDLIEPVAETDPLKFDLLKLSGTVPRLSGGFCHALPNLESLRAQELSMEEIDDNAFQGCNKLEEIWAKDNKFVKIGKNTFKGLKNLTSITLTGGNMPVFDVDLSDAKKLLDLTLAEMNISEISPELLRENRQLDMLRLESNNLHDLDIEKILEYTPDLKIIFLDGNNFECNRLRQILAKLRAKNVRVPPPYIETVERRKHNGNVGGFDCISNRRNDL